MAGAGSENCYLLATLRKQLIGFIKLPALELPALELPALELPALELVALELRAYELVPRHW